MKMNDRIRLLLVFAIIAILASIAVMRLAQQGKLSFNSQGVPQIQNIQTDRIVKEENAVISAVEKSSPSVVAIGVNQRIVNPFDPFSNPERRESTIGTGFVVSDERGSSASQNKAIIITNRHVVDNPDTKYSVVTKDGKKLEVTKIYRDPNLDLALVQVSGSDIKHLELGDSSNLKAGQSVIAIGNALGRFENTVTTGVVSGIGRSVTAGDPFAGTSERLDDLIQTDAAINPGNSGGPLLNLAGQVIGVNVATTEGAQNIGFAIPINAIKPLLNEFERTGTVSKPYLGIRYVPISKENALRNNVPQGAYVDEVLEGSPANKAGIEPGDIITKIDGQSVDDDKKISETIQKKKVGDRLTLEVFRDNNTRTVTATLEQTPGQ
jgi:serine protease Do